MSSGRENAVAPAAESTATVAALVVKPEREERGTKENVVPEDGSENPSDQPLIFVACSR
jgi:hypothetical protein